MANKVPLSSANVAATDATMAIRALQSDMQTVGRFLNTSTTIALTGSRVVVPQAGALDVYIVADTATASSSGVNYHLIKALRSGQDEGRTYDTRTLELPAYSLVYLGTFNVGAGDLIKVSLTVTGAPAPTLSLDNITLLCSLTPTTAV